MDNIFVILESLLDFRLNTFVSFNTDNIAGSNVNVVNNDVINPNVIIQPKSITGLIPLKIKDKNAQIVVKAVYIIGKNIFCVVFSKILIFFSFANSALICKNLVLI